MVIAKAIVTNGLKCAPETGPKVRIKIPKTKIVESPLTKRATRVSSERLVPMIPEPTTVATRTVVPKYSPSSAR